jgi:hypothetical protein
MPGEISVEILTKCRVQHLSRGDVRFVAAGTPEDSFMSTVLPSIIVLVITALIVFRRELTTPQSSRESRSRPTRSRRKA